MQPIINSGSLRFLTRSAKSLRINKLASATIKRQPDSPDKKNRYTLFDFRITFLFSIQTLRFFFKL